MVDAALRSQLDELLELIEAHVGAPAELYSLVFDGEAALDGEDLEQDEDETPPLRILCPPIAEQEVQAAEARLGFSLPPLLRAVYTQIGNGGLCLRLLGLRGGQTGGEDLFPGLNAEEIYQELDQWRREGKITYLPPRLFPINDDLGCGMVDYVDCRTPEGKIWRTDSGHLLERQPTLMAYFREAISACPPLRPE